MPSLVKRSNGVYYQVTCLAGRRIWRSTGVRTRPEAKKVIANGLKNARSKPDLTVTQFLTEFLPYARTNLAPSTVELYVYSTKSFIHHLGDQLLLAYRPLDAERFKTLRVGEVSPVRVNLEFRTVKALFQTAVRWGLIEKNPLAGVKQIRIPPRRPVYLTKEEFSHLTRTMNLPWLKQLTQFAVSTMMRIGEIVNLRWDSIDLARRVILIENTDDFRTKTTRPRSVPMNEWVFSFLATRENKTGYVFNIPSGGRLNVRYASRRFKEYVRKAKLPEAIHFHTLRHTGASWLVQDGVSIYAVQKILGHSSIQVTMGYSHLVSAELHGVVNRIQMISN